MISTDKSPPHNDCVRLNAWALPLGFAILCLALPGCESGTHVTPRFDGGSEPAKEDKKSEVAPKPVPKTTSDLQALGIPVFPGAVIADESNSSTLDEKVYSRTYKVKMYAPKDYATVLGAYMKAIKDVDRLGDSDFQKLKGKTEVGDEIEVMLGPAADHGKTLVMVWLTQEK